MSFYSQLLQHFITHNEPRYCDCPSEMIPFSACKVWKTFVTYFHSTIETLEHQMSEKNRNLGNWSDNGHSQTVLEKFYPHLKTHLIRITSRYNISSGTSSEMMFWVQIQKWTTAACKPLFIIFPLVLILSFLTKMPWNCFILLNCSNYSEGPFLSLIEYIKKGWEKDWKDGMS